MPRKGQKKKDMTPAQKRQYEKIRKDFSKADLKRVSEMAATGLTQEEIGAEFGMAGRTFRRRMEENQEIRDAYDIARSKWKAVAIGKFHTVINRIGTDDEKAKDVSLLIFFHKAQLGWRETSRVEVADGSVTDIMEEQDAADEAWDEYFDEED